MGIRSVSVCAWDRFAWLDFTNRPVTADRTRVTKLRWGCLRAMRRGYRSCAAAGRRQSRADGAQRAHPFRRHQELTARHPGVHDRRRASGWRRPGSSGHRWRTPVSHWATSGWCSSPAPSAQSQAGDEPQYEGARRARMHANDPKGSWPRGCSSSHVGVSRVPLKSAASSRMRHSPPAPCIQRLGHRLVPREDPRTPADTGVDANENVVR